MINVSRQMCLFPNRDVFCHYWSSFSPFWSIYKPFWFIVSSFLRDIFDLGPVPYSIFRSVPWNVIKPKKCEKRNIRLEYGRCNGSECTGGRVQEYKERHLSCQQLAGPCSSKLKGCGRNPFFLCFVLFLFGNSFNRELRFFFKFAFCCLSSPIGKWLLVFFINKFFHLLPPQNSHIHKTNRVLLERKKFLTI